MNLMLLLPETKEKQDTFKKDIIRGVRWYKIIKIIKITSRE